MFIQPKSDTSSALVTKPISGPATAMIIDSGASSASLMPTPRQTINGIETIHSTARSVPDYTNMQHARIYSPRQAPSAITSENFLAAKIRPAMAAIESGSAIYYLLLIFKYLIFTVSS